MSSTERTAEDVKRDPRVDPMPGDVMRAVDGWEREVAFVDTYEVKFNNISPRRGVGFWGLTTWRKWARTAEVIHIAQPKEKTDGE